MDKNKTSLMSPSLQDDDKMEDTILRPTAFSGFMGQEKVKDNLKVFINSAKKRSEALDHVFLSAPPGLGKTTLAGIIASEMGVPIRYTSAPVLDKPKDLAGILTNLGENSVFFIDEIHRLKPALEEMLYIAMEDFELDWVVGQGPSARTMRVPLSPFTLIGATTKAGGVSAPLYSRFGITVRLDFYTPEELKLIIGRNEKIMGVEFTPDAATMLSKASRGTPRIANRLIKRLRDFAVNEDKKIIDKDLLSKALKRLEINENGLEAQDINILKNIIYHYGGGPVGAETLAISIGESIDTLEDFYEPYLIQCGYLKRTPRGRVVTQAAYKLIGSSFSGGDDENNRFLF
ncbi:MAG: Holliday junction branch migration DNA helicase RuvB [Sphaerochaetaceae bacterium]|nr:Holliday junction branch migration DNA helicase RuvB [Sphaerochaetaceae bacterium]